MSFTDDARYASSSRARLAAKARALNLQFDPRYYTRDFDLLRRYDAIDTKKGIDLSTADALRRYGADLRRRQMSGELPRANRSRNLRRATSAITMATRMTQCAFARRATLDPDTRQLILRNRRACKLRICQNCARMVCNEACRRLLKVTAALEKRKFLLWTLTAELTAFNELGPAIDTRKAAFKRLLKHPLIDGKVHGTYHVFETTLNREKRMWHGHFHALIAVDAAYRKDNAELWISQPALVRAWSDANNTNKSLIVFTQYLRGQDRDDPPWQLAKSLREVCKYLIAPMSIHTRVNNRWVTDGEAALVFSEAFHRRRTATATGDFLKTARSLAAPSPSRTRKPVHV